MFRNFLKIAFRSLWKNKLYTGINLAGLATAFTCAILVILFIKDEFSYDTFHANAANLYRITTMVKSEDGSVEKVGITGQIQGPAFHDAIPEIKNHVRLFNAHFIIKTDEKALGLEGLFADQHFFELFSFPLLYGATPFSDPSSVVLTGDAAIKLFGKKDVTGKTLTISHGSFSKTFKVTAIASGIPSNSSIRFEILVPFSYLEESWRDNDWLNQYLSTFVLLQPNADPEKVENKFQHVFTREAKEQIQAVQKAKGYAPERKYGLQSITDIHLNRTDLKNEDSGRNSSGIDAGGLMYSYILMGIVAFILLMACINFVNLSIATSFKRAKEIGVRKITGSSRIAIISQFLLEGTILCIIAFIISLLLAQLFMPGFNSFVGKQLSILNLLDFQLFFIWVLVISICILLAGLYPAIVLSHFNAVSVLSNKLKITSGHWLGQSLVVIQFSLAICLIIATIVYLQQMQFISTKDLGYNGSNIIRIFIPRDESGNAVRAIKSDFLFHPSVKDVAVASDNSVAVLGGFPTEINNRKIKYVETHADEDFLSLAGIELSAGRNFNPSFKNDLSEAAIVNETFVKAAGLTNPIGQQFANTWGTGEMRTIIGVVKDYHYSSLKDQIYPQVILMTDRLPYFWVKIHPGKTAESIAAMQSVFNKYAPAYPFEYKFLEDETSAQYETEKQWQRIIQNAAILSILICCIGLFGLAHLASLQRTKEIGIRKVLGASGLQILSLLSSRMIWLTILASVIAFPVAWLVMNKWLQDFAYRINIQGWMFIAGGLAGVVIAMFTVGIQAFRVAIANPVISLRSE